MDVENLTVRIISGIVLVTIFLAAIFLYRPIFMVICYIIATFMLSEWFLMIHNERLNKIHRISYSLVGLLIISIPICSLLFISNLDSNGWILLTLFLCISSVDIFAMFGGKVIGGPKLAPTISPNKTISGLLCGICFASINVNLLTLITSFELPLNLHSNNIKLTLYILLLSIISQISDLFISYFKRKFRIKDTGSIIPGHGGALDRFDSLILTSPVVFIYLTSNF